MDSSVLIVHLQSPSLHLHLNRLRDEVYKNRNLETELNKLSALTLNAHIQADGSNYALKRNLVRKDQRDLCRIKYMILGRQDSPPIWSPFRT